MKASVTVEGRPRPKGRPRLGRGGRVFTPAQTVDYEQRVAWECRARRVRLGRHAVSVRIELWSETMLRGDLDNYAKSVLDGLQLGQAIDNDRQVHRLQVQTVVGNGDKTVIHLETIGEVAA